MTVQILFVDDEPNALEGYQRGLRREFTVTTAASGAEGLAVLERSVPYAVVVADRRMPGLDGVQFLAQVRARWPDTVRVMLTGQADLASTIDAVNAGHVFRFLNKPCPREDLVATLRDALEQYRLVTAEHDLLHHTLVGSIRALTDLLSAVSPVAFSRTPHLRRSLRHLAGALDAAPAWPFEIAALLAPIGCVALPAELIIKHYAGEQLTEAEQRLFAAHPARGQHMLENIPRLETVARMIGAQQEPYGGFEPDSAGESDLVALGAQCLCAALEYDQLRAWGMPHADALDRLEKRAGRYNPRVLAALRRLPEAAGAPPETPLQLRVRDLQIGMVAAEDIRAGDGTCLVVKGQSLTYPVLERVRVYAERLGVAEPVAMQTATALELSPDLPAA